MVSYPLFFHCPYLSYSSFQFCSSSPFCSIIYLAVVSFCYVLFPLFPQLKPFAWLLSYSLMAISLFHHLLIYPSQNLQSVLPFSAISLNFSHLCHSFSPPHLSWPPPAYSPPGLATVCSNPPWPIHPSNTQSLMWGRIKMRQRTRWIKLWNWWRWWQHPGDPHSWFIMLGEHSKVDTATDHN